MWRLVPLYSTVYGYATSCGHGGGIHSCAARTRRLIQVVRARDTTQHAKLYEGARTVNEAAQLEEANMVAPAQS